MQNEILRKNPNAHVQVFAVWLPALTEDIVWDHYILFGPDATWNDVPALGDGGDVIRVADQLRAQIRPFLQ